MVEKTNWSAAELDLQVASPGPGRHRLSGRERILAETLHQRGNRVVTKQTIWSLVLCSFPAELLCGTLREAGGSISSRGTEKRTS
jgi:hypothetical protein